MRLLVELERLEGAVWLLQDTVRGTGREEAARSAQGPLNSGCKTALLILSKTSKERGA